MRKKSLLLAAVLASLAMLTVAAPKLEFTWKNPNYTGGTFKNILVLALNGKAANRAEFEDELVAAITRPGAKAYPSYEFMPRPDLTPIDMNDMRELVKEQNFDAIVVARLTKKDTKTTYIPGQTYTPFPYYGTFYGYYGALSPIIYTPGYMETEKQAQVEVNSYSTAKPDGELVWTGTTNTFDVGSVKKIIKDLVKVVSKELEKENVIQPESK
ncbi:MAG TPA: hypothetical protein VK703_11910 [Candidatus Acidoferrales bacterium]|jgi:hypothetical protein|nr:hypothetical protein [Candidatus Acidoferrales bacterium]